MTDPRRLSLLAAAFALVVLLAPSPSAAQSSRAPPDIQASYDRFIVAFRAALKANDAAAVTALTLFPFYWDEMRDAAYFRQNLYARVFTRKARDCIGRARGRYGRDGLGKDHFTIVCGEDLYLFTATPEGFRFSEVGVND